MGQTTQSLTERLKKHCRIHLNDGTYLHNDMLKYGVENFIIEKIDEAYNQYELNKLEYYWINKLNSWNHETGYNININGFKCGGNTLSNNPNLAIISKKISDSKRGFKNPNSVSVLVYDINENVYKEYSSMIECQKQMGIPYHTIISKRCRGIIRKPYLGRFYFSYKSKCVTTNGDECSHVGQEIGACSKQGTVEIQKI